MADALGLDGRPYQRSVGKYMYSHKQKRREDLNNDQISEQRCAMLQISCADRLRRWR